MFVVSIICAGVARMFRARYPLIDMLCDGKEDDCDHHISMRLYWLSPVIGYTWQILGPISFLAMVFAFTIGIILMNVAIAVISNKYTEVEGKSEIAFWESCLRYIVELENVIFFCCIVELEDVLF